MRFRLYLADKTGTYVDVSDRVHGELGGFGLKASPSDGTGSLVPPSAITLDNADGMFTTETTRTASRWNGDWSERLARVTMVTGDQPELTLGVFRIHIEGGIRARGDGTAILRFEALEQKLKRGDASDITYRNGWHQQIPWPSAIDMIRKPESTAAISLPSAQVEYEGFQYGLSTLGRPGDYRSDGFHEQREAITGVCYNSYTNRFAFCSLRHVYEYDPDTGIYTDVALTFVASWDTTYADHDFLGIWFRRGSSSASQSYYLMLGAPREESSQTGGSGYYQPRDQYRPYVSEFRIFRSNYATTYGYTSEDANLAPVIYRGVAHQSIGVASGLYLGPNDGDGSSSHPGRETLLAPFPQYQFCLFSRLTQASEIYEYGDDIYYGFVETGETHHPLLTSILSGTQSWTITRDDLKTDRSEFDDNTLRMGRGYYTHMLSTNAVAWGSGVHHAGFRHSLGNGPMFDMVFPEGDTAYSDSWWCFFCWTWTGTYWQLRYRLYTGSAYYSGTVVTLGAGVLPTYVRAISNLGTTVNYQIYLSYGWIDYGTTSTDDQITLGASEYHAVRSVARSGVGIAVSAPVPTSGALSWEVNNVDTQTFTETVDAVATANQYYTGASPSEVGRWTPVGCSMSHERSGQWNVISLNIICIDRMDCAGGDQGNGIPYRIFFNSFQQITGTLSQTAYGAGQRKLFTSSTPPMGMTSVCWGMHLEYEFVAGTYFYNPSEGGLYYQVGNGPGEPVLLAAISIDDPYLTMGALAAGNSDYYNIHQVAGGTSPVFPLTGEDRWPDGQYYAILLSEQHGGRVGLLDLENLDKLAAIGLLATIGDSVFFFDRSGSPILKARPTYYATSQLTLRPEHYGSIERAPISVTNYATRSVYDVIPGDAKITLYLTPDSEWNVEPKLTGFNVYPVDVEIRCIGGGLVSQQPTRWAYRSTTTRITTSLKTALTSGGGTCYLNITADIEENDLLTFSTSDDSKRIISIDRSSGLVDFSGTVGANYAAGDPVWVDKAASGRWSDKLFNDGQLRGASWVALGVTSGHKVFEVGSAWPFAAGVRFQVHDADGTVQYSDDVYTVTRVELRDEYGGDHDRIYFETATGGGLVQGVSTYDAITCWLEMTPEIRTATVGQPGIVFSAYGIETADVENDDEKPVVEGDKLSIHYPGLITEKNSVSKATAKDVASAELYGEKKPSRSRPNKFMDLPLATMDVNRTVRRGAGQRIALKLDDVTHEDVMTLEPLDVVTVENRALLGDYAANSVKCMVTSVKHRGVKVSLKLEELNLAFTRDRGADTWDRGTDTDLVFYYAADPQAGSLLADATALNELNDNGPNQNHATQGSAAREPAYDAANHALLGDGIDDHFTCGVLQCHDNTGGMEIVVLYKASGTTGRYICAQYESSGAPNRIWWLRDDSFCVFEDGASYVLGGYVNWTPASDGNWHVIRARWIPGEPTEVWLDGVSVGTSSGSVTDLDIVSQATMIMSFRYGYPGGSNCDHPIKALACWNQTLSGEKYDMVWAHFDELNPDT